jgi:GDPmannose 4,6-dehydratase
LDAKRDWGYAEDYVKAMVKIINHHTPEVFVVATGIARTVREWCEATVKAAMNELDLPYSPIEWKGFAEQEKGYFNGELLFCVDREFYRPAEVDLLLGDASKASHTLDWRPETSFEEMVECMFRYDFAKLTEVEFANGQIH